MGDRLAEQQQYALQAASLRAANRSPKVDGALAPQALPQWPSVFRQRP